MRWGKGPRSSNVERARGADHSLGHRILPRRGRAVPIALHEDAEEPGGKGELDIGAARTDARGCWPPGGDR